jgi:hypothetical protein
LKAPFPLLPPAFGSNNYPHATGYEEEDNSFYFIPSPGIRPIELLATTTASPADRRPHPSSSPAGRRPHLPSSPVGRRSHIPSSLADRHPPPPELAGRPPPPPPKFAGRSPLSPPELAGRPPAPTSRAHWVASPPSCSAPLWFRRRPSTPLTTAGRSSPHVIGTGDDGRVELSGGNLSSTPPPRLWPRRGAREVVCHA